jgi:hypothetical protein
VDPGEQTTSLSGGTVVVVEVEVVVVKIGGT